jgi:hypothetical protein
MTLIKKIDVEKHFAARRAMRLGRIRPLCQPGAARNVPAVAAKNTPAFSEDFTQEHSSPEVSAVSIPITSVSGENRLLRPPGSRQR